MKLVKNAKDAWRWFSVQAAVIGGAASVAWLAVPHDLAASVPWWAQSVVTAVIFAGVFFGRLVDQGGDDVKQEDTT